VTFAWCGRYWIWFTTREKEETRAASQTRPRGRAGRNHPGPGVGVRAKEENQDRGHERCGCRPLVRRHNVVIALCDIKRARVVEHIKAAGFTDATETQAAFREAGWPQRFATNFVRP
jgi:hypothetical protein